MQYVTTHVFPIIGSEPLESSTIFEPVVTVARLVFSVPLYLLTWLRLYRIDLPSSVGQPFSAAYFLGTASG
jgi:hypothetical protein